VEKLPDAEAGKNVRFDKILVVNDGNETHVGTPYLDAASMDATVTAVGKGDKVIVFKFKAKKGYRRKQGHRQPFTEIEIESVSLGGKTVFKNETPTKVDKPDPVKNEEDGESGKPDDANDEASAVDAADADKTEATPAEAEQDEENAGAEDEDRAPEKEETTESEDEDEGDAEAESETEQSEDADSADNPATETSKKMTKPDIMAKLDELGVSYSKNAKKDELFAILEDAEK
ncbi:MAG: 50S ribosomal protein L21, partial [Clostridiales Family XIII bacterium]|jgi:large subunit ribosomal protein L21|nr:50S ribosomal protein L21 [Clostridiales Family XIII bacterium]